LAKIFRIGAEFLILANCSFLGDAADLFRSLVVALSGRAGAKQECLI
jgi:hypothetical protein